MAKQNRGELRLIHVLCEDDEFCAQLLNQIKRHLEAVSPNWRETHYMSTLLTLVLRACTLGSRRSVREASIAVQENLYTNPSNLSTLLKGMLIRDLALAVSFKDELRQPVETCTQSIAAAITNVWPEAAGSYGQWSFLSSEIWWLTFETRETTYMPRQRVHFHLLEGCLLIDYQPIGRLPRDMQESPIVQELFQNQVLSAYPSAMPGMTYAITHLREGHQVHAERIDGEVVVRARIHQVLLEFVERSVFRGPVEADLSGTLIDDYVHWLNLDNGHLEFRKRLRKWGFGSPDSWILNFPARRAHRQEVSLVNPLCPLSREVTKVF
ncbi:hypothetical protein SI65_00035 [Aspergillus cristatus]|uniref:Uncharacterized protein n=1 Tax=Aspergillus cristatus TaxID=573508 RepID=A0A1E3BNH4_ASPCR|nr:hypothetical protein SI65_00035 [Aspergillus cristatus]